MTDPYLPHEAKIIERIQEGPDIFTIRLQFSDPEVEKNYSFEPGQFNMLYLYGVGEVAISIVSDPDGAPLYDHTIRVVGRTTGGFAELKAGDSIGVRGPFGRGWPVDAAKGKDVVILTGGLGCAPLVAMVNYIRQRHDEFGTLHMMQGVKHSNDLIYRNRFERLKNMPKVKLYVAADKGDKHWPWYEGRVTDLVPQLNLDKDNTVAFMCGPEIMMKVGVRELLKHGLTEQDLYLNMERNMHCAVGHCGHCQYGGDFICKDGPVFHYPKIKHLLAQEGF